MATMNVSAYHDQSLETTVERLEAVEAKLDRLLAAVEQLDRRREEIEEFVEDLMPAANGAIRIAISRLDALEKSGAFALVADRAPEALRLAETFTSPQVTVLADRIVQALGTARKGAPPSIWKLMQARKDPRVLRGAGVLLEILRTIGEGVPASAAHAPIVVKPAAPKAPKPASAPRAVAAPALAPSAAPTPAPAVGGQKRQIAGVAVDVDAEGFLVDPKQWTREIGEALATEAGLPRLTPRHWEVIEWCRSDAAASGAAPGLRRITQGLGISPKEMYALFPKGPGILAARVAGLGKPKSCV